MYAAVAYRGREIATLRGDWIFRAEHPDFFVLESLLLSLLGALVGSSLMLPFNGHDHGHFQRVTFSEMFFSLRMTLPVVVTAVGLH